MQEVVMSQVKQAWYKADPRVCRQDLYFVLTPITRFCRIAGIFPLTLKGDVNKRKYSSSYFFTIYSFAVLVLVLAGLFTWTDRTNERSDSLSQHTIMYVSINFEMILAVSSMIIMVGTAILNRNKFVNAIETLNLQDILLSKLGTKIDYAKDLKQKYIQWGITVLIIVTLCTSDFFYQLDFNIRYPLNWGAWMLPNIIRMAGTCLFVDVVILLKQRFAAVNKHLKKMIHQTKDSSIMTIYTTEQNYEKIRSIAMIHGSLCEAARSVNETYGFNIIAGVIYALIILTSGTYFIFRYLKESNTDYVRIFGCLNWSMYSSIDIFYMVTACHFAQNQASLTGKLIHKFKIGGDDTRLNNVIHSFSLQLHHERLEFSAAGLFPLDATLIQSIVGAVTTYLVILIQFDTSTSHLIPPNGANNSIA